MSDHQKTERHILVSMMWPFKMQGGNQALHASKINFLRLVWRSNTKIWFNRKKHNDMKIEIACPKCQWEPKGGAHWMCSCWHVWNTFETAGKCPKCSKRWADTQCPGPGDPGGCGSWSKHIDWYQNLDEEMKKAIASSLKVESNVDR